MDIEPAEELASVQWKPSPKILSPKKSACRYCGMLKTAMEAGDFTRLSEPRRTDVLGGEGADSREAWRERPIAEIVQYRKGLRIFDRRLSFLMVRGHQRRKKKLDVG